MWNVPFFLHSEPGDRVEVDEPIAQIETDKVLVHDFIVIGHLELFSAPLDLCFS